MYQSIINQSQPKMQEVVEKFKESLQALRVGRANAAMVDGIMVNYYGKTTPLKQLASIATPQADQILITPWDQNSLGDIELALRNSNLGLSPANDGRTIRLILPPLTEERRNELSKTVQKTAEEAKVVFRQIRQEVWEKIKTLEKEGKLTEDDRYRSEEELNKTINEFNRKIEELADHKEAELKNI